MESIIFQHFVYMNLKKISIIFLVNILLYSCADYKIEKKETENSYLDFWEIKYFVNQNNKPTDVGYITNAHTIIGQFSTSNILNNTLK